MKIKILLLGLLVFAMAACNFSMAKDNQKPILIFFSYEGMPRAHLPSVVWFQGTSVPVGAFDNEEHDEMWKIRIDTAPKFSISRDAYIELCSLLLRFSLGEKSPYVVEFNYDSRRSVVRYIDARSFEQLRSMIKKKGIKGNEVLADWP